MATQDEIQYGPYGALRRRSSLAPKTQSTGINIRSQLTPYAQAYIGEQAARQIPVAPPAPSAPSAGYETLRDVGEGNTSDTPTSGQFGPMSEAERSLAGTITGGPVGWGMAAMGMDRPTGIAGRLGTGIANQGVKTGLSLAGVPTFGPSVVSLMGKLALGYDALRSRLGVNPAIGYVGPTQADLQSVTDKFGAYAGRTAAAQAAARENDPGYDIGSRIGGPAGYAETPAAPSVGNPDLNPTGVSVPAGQFGPMGGNEPGSTLGQGVDMGENAETGGYAGLGMGGPGGYGDSGNGSQGGTTDGSRGGSDVGSDAAGTGGGWGKGGFKNFTRPTRIKVGERGTEFGVFVPKTMEKKGIQPRELMVLRGLLQALKKLGA